MEQSISKRPLLALLTIVATALPVPGQYAVAYSNDEASVERTLAERVPRLMRVLSDLRVDHPAVAEARFTARNHLVELWQREPQSMTIDPGSNPGELDELLALEPEIQRLEALALLFASTGSGTDLSAMAAADPPAVVRGRITGPGGEPAVGAQVAAYDEDGRFAGVALTDVHGRYQLAPTLPGLLSLRVRANGLLDVATGSAPCASSCERVGSALAVPERGAVSGDFKLGAGLSVSGTVTEDGTTTPLESIPVNAVDGSNTLVGSAPTNANGEYVISGLSAGDIWVVTANISPWVDETYDDHPLPGHWGAPDHGDAVTLTEDQSATGIDFALVEGGHIDGTITDAATTDPIPSSQVFFFDSSGQRIIGNHTSTNSSGQYLSHAQPPGTAYVQAWGPFHAGYVDQFYPDLLCPRYAGCDLADATAINVVSGVTETADLALSIGASISGSVLSAATNDPLDGKVTLYRDDGTRITDRFIEADGSYVFTALLDDAFHLASSENTNLYFDELYDDLPIATPITDGTQVVTTLGVETSGIDFVLDRGSAIEGTLTHAATGDPIPYARVHASDAGTGGDIFSDDTDINGSFRIAPLPPGDYRVMTILPDPWVDELYDDVVCTPNFCDQTAATLITVGADEIVGGIDIALDLPSTVSGRVTSAATGLPIEGAAVLALDGGNFESDFTAADGTYEITLYRGNFQVIASHEGLMRQVYGGGYCASLSCDGAGTPVAVGSESHITGIDLALEEGGVVSGTVTSVADGSPVPLVRIWLYDETGLPIEGLRTDPVDGTYELPPVPLGGTYYLNAWLPPAGFLRELWQNRPGIFTIDIVPYPGILNGRPIDFGGGAAVTIDLDLDTVDTAKTLTVEVVAVDPGAGGTITTDPGGIDCGQACSAPFQTGGGVSLVATPDSGSLFVGWGGDADCGDGDLTMTDERSCTASFEVDPSGMIFADDFESGDLLMWAP
jgi:hypothetical protein